MCSSLRVVLHKESVVSLRCYGDGSVDGVGLMFAEDVVIFGGEGQQEHNSKRVCKRE